MSSKRLRRAHVVSLVRSLSKKRSRALCTLFNRQRRSELLRVPFPCSAVVSDLMYSIYREALGLFAQGRTVTRIGHKATRYYRVQVRHDCVKFADEDIWEYYDFYWGVKKSTKVIKPPFVITDGTYAVRLHGRHRVCLARYLGATTIDCRAIPVEAFADWMEEQHT